MARRSDGEKIDELTEFCAGVKVSLENLAKELHAVDNAHSKTTEGLADLRREYEKEIALLKKEVEDLKKWTDDQKKEQAKRSDRFWAFGPNVVGAVINVLLAAIVAYFVANR